MTNTIGTSNAAGTQNLPPNNGDTDYLFSVGTGGFIGANVYSGGDGEVVIIW